MNLRTKITSFIEQCNCIGELDKYFWIKQVRICREDYLAEIQEVLLQSEVRLINLELESIQKIKTLLEDTYPDIESDYLPSYMQLFQEFKQVQNELTINQINAIRDQLHNEIPTQRKKHTRSNLVKGAELHAKNILFKSSNPKTFETKQQVIDRIEKIERSVRGFDLVIESETFRYLATITGVNLPRFSDRIIQGYTQLTTLKKDSVKITIQSLSEILHFVFIWDKELSSDIHSDIQNILIPYAIKNIAKSAIIKPNQALLELFHGLYSKERGMEHLLIPYLFYIITKIRLTSLVFTSLIPNLIRALARKEGMKEQSVLSLHSNELRKIAKKSRVGNDILRLVTALTD
ncbi:hypothetical protein KC717_06985, partial [Candidatus Dojkabacteria bacterium]|nr:hypothetical protein [Candidatus Dojkabacteria bacterium]